MWLTKKKKAQTISIQKKLVSRESEKMLNYEELNLFLGLNFLDVQIEMLT
jgi:hypothetical protein